MAPMFLGAKDHRISASDLDHIRVRQSQHRDTPGVLRFYQTRRNAAVVESDAPFASTPRSGPMMSACARHQADITATPINVNLSDSSGHGVEMPTTRF